MVLVLIADGVRVSETFPPPPTPIRRSNQLWLHLTESKCTVKNPTGIGPRQRVRLKIQPAADGRMVAPAKTRQVRGASRNRSDACLSTSLAGCAGRCCLVGSSSTLAQGYLHGIYPPDFGSDWAGPIRAARAAFEMPPFASLRKLTAQNRAANSVGSRSAERAPYRRVKMTISSKSGAKLESHC